MVVASRVKASQSSSLSCVGRFHEGWNDSFFTSAARSLIDDFIPAPPFIPTYGPSLSIGLWVATAEEEGLKGAIVGIALALGSAGLQISRGPSFPLKEPKSVQPIIRPFRCFFRRRNPPSARFSGRRQFSSARPPKDPGRRVIPCLAACTGGDESLVIVVSVTNDRASSGKTTTTKTLSASLR